MRLPGQRAKRCGAPGGGRPARIAEPPGPSASARYAHRAMCDAALAGKQAADFGLLDSLSIGNG
jgi:hypothetical protein